VDGPDEAGLRWAPVTFQLFAEVGECGLVLRPAALSEDVGELGRFVVVELDVFADLAVVTAGSLRANLAGESECGDVGSLLEELGDLERVALVEAGSAAERERYGRHGEEA
jgi:hypothetical protein